MARGGGGGGGPGTGRRRRDGWGDGVQQKFCHDKTRLLSRQKYAREFSGFSFVETNFVAVSILLYKNYTSGSSRQ